MSSSSTWKKPTSPWTTQKKAWATYGPGDMIPGILDNRLFQHRARKCKCKVTSPTCPVGFKRMLWFWVYLGEPKAFRPSTAPLMGPNVSPMISRCWPKEAQDAESSKHADALEARSVTFCHVRTSKRQAQATRADQRCRPSYDQYPRRTCHTRYTRTKMFQEPYIQPTTITKPDLLCSHVEGHFT